MIEQIAPFITEQFSDLVGIPRDIVKIELFHVEPITNSPLTVEILMFQREQEIHDAVASMIHTKLCDCGYPNPHIFFVILSPSLYYKEGKPLNEIPASISSYST
ncbi:DUF1904 domain-containing protein [Paenibacillus sp. P26]|nr:DUF1904 domain-containing protein [Paenibacillus sp. P26]UUZ96267.1 DUF1904 domain-containing protein [Paenibacillus sp. P25]